jgi:ATP-dependent helicase HepA
MSAEKVTALHSPSAIRPGALVSSMAHRDLGIGKVVSSFDGRLGIEYFDSVVAPSVHQIEVESDRVLPARLDRQMRVFFREGGIWRVGRVLETALGGRVRVRPPGDSPDLWLAEQDLFMRWDRPLENPLEILRARTTESPHHYFSRRDFVDSMLEEIAATQGSRALSSSAIALYDHQFAVVGRVLSDPVRRFLLADEVGLGKTIEAGLILRQQLLDQPESTVRVIAPRRICHQWERELRERFFIEDFTVADVQIVAAEDPGALDATPDGLDFLIIDEAHHPARWATGSDRQRQNFDRLAGLAHSTPSLLLLSATPVAADQAAYLAMLYLIDPDNYDLSGLDEFSRRVADRQELARRFVALRPGQLYRRIVGMADRMRELLRDDEASLACLEDLTAAGADAPRVLLDERIRALRVAISDRHRIHYRMLRSRREQAPDFPARGRRLGRAVTAVDPGPDVISAWIDRWRNALVADSIATENDWLPAAREILKAAFSLEESFGIAVRARLERSAPDEVGPEERRLLEEWLERDHRGTSTAAVEAIVDFVWGVPRRTKVVVFTNSTAAAIRIRDALVELLVDGQVASHLDAEALVDTEKALRRFRETRECNVLVCDRSGEEGLNLQFADIVLHAELPFNPNRLEQRIGRLDRHGRGGPVESVILADDREGSLLGAWTDVLASAFGAFDRSISAFQFAVDKVMPEVIRATVEDGTVGLLGIGERLPEILERERQDIAEQEYLDSIEAIDLDVPSAEPLRARDERFDYFEACHERLICNGKGQLRFRRRDYFEDLDHYSYWASDPVRGGEPMVAARDLDAFFDGSFSTSTLARYGSHDREAILESPGRRIWAAGDPFLDGMLEYVRRRDDRGRAYAFVKMQADHGANPPIAALRFDFIVEAAPLSDRLGESARLALARRLVGHLPPFVETIWVDVGVDEIVDPDLIRRLAGRYSTTFGDRYLHPGRWDVLDDAFPGLDWEAWCDGADQMTRETVLARTTTRQRFEDARAGAARVAEARMEALRGRQRLVTDVGSALAFEEAAANAIGDALSRPTLVADAVGFVILCGDSLGSPG